MVAAVADVLVFFRNSICCKRDSLESVGATNWLNASADQFLPSTNWVKSQVVFGGSSLSININDFVPEFNPVQSDDNRADRELNGPLHSSQLLNNSHQISSSNFDYRCFSNSTHIWLFSRNLKKILTLFSSFTRTLEQYLSL